MQYISSVYTGCNYVTGLSHHGIIGMKWGVRRFQNEDGTLTDLGKKRYEKNAKYRMDNGELRDEGAYQYNKHVEKANKLYDKVEKRINRDIAGRHGFRNSQILMRANKQQAKAQMYKENPELLKRAMELGEKFVPLSMKDKVARSTIAAGATAASIALIATGALPIGFIFIPKLAGGKYADSKKIAKEARTHRLREVI